MNPTARFAVFAFAFAVFHGLLLLAVARGWRGDGGGEGGEDGGGGGFQTVWSKAFAEGLQGGELGLRERRGLAIARMYHGRWTMYHVRIRLAVARGVGDGREAGGEGCSGLRGGDGLDFKADELGDGFCRGAEAGGGEGGDDLSLGGAVVLLLRGEGEGGELGGIRESIAEDAAAELAVDAFADGAGGGGAEALEGFLVGIAGGGAGACLRGHGELAAEGELEEGIVAPAGAGFESLRVVPAGLEGVQFGAVGDGAGAFADELLNDGIEAGGLRLVCGSGHFEEDGGVAEEIQEGVPGGLGVVLGADEEEGGQIDGGGRAEDEAILAQGFQAVVGGLGGGVVATHWGLSPQFHVMPDVKKKRVGANPTRRHFPSEQ